MNEKFDKYFDQLEFDSKLEFIKSTVNSTVKNKKRLNNALEKESKFHQVCTRGAGSTASANASKIAIIYQDQLDLLQYCVDRLQNAR